MKNPNINICLRMVSTAGGRFLAGTTCASLARQGVRRRLPRGRDSGRWSFKTLTVGSHDAQDVLVSKLVIDVADFSRPGVAALRYNHSSLIPKHDRLRNLFLKVPVFIQ